MYCLVTECQHLPYGNNNNVRLTVDRGFYRHDSIHSTQINKVNRKNDPTMVLLFFLE